MSTAPESSHHGSRSPTPIPPIVVQCEASSFSVAQDHAINSSSNVGRSVSPDQGNGIELSKDVKSSPFKKITTDIPTGRFEENLFSSQLQFSKRGSVFLGSKEANSFAKPLKKSTSVRSAIGGANFHPSNGVPLSGLRRVSTDERRLSRRVRSFYETQEGMNLGLTNPLGSSFAESQIFDDFNHAVEPELDAETRSLHPSPETQAHRPSSALSARNESGRDAHEAAGGIEDWTDVDSKTVDRWGFIRERNLSSKRSSLTSAPVSSNSDKQRGYRTAAATLPVVDEALEGQNGHTEKSKYRFSLSPGGKALKSTPSIISGRSKRSAASRLVSLRSGAGRPRWLSTAPEMLAPTNTNSDESLNYHHYSALEARRADKWQKMAKAVPEASSSRGAGTRFSFNKSDPKLISRVWKGIPDRWRAEAWHAFLTSSASAHSNENRPNPSDEELEAFFHSCQEYDCADDAQIDMDVPRTIGNHIQFRKRYHGGQRFLFRVLRALSLYFPDIGYVQGMASVIATLLVYYEESQAFVMAVRLWQLRGIKKLYAEGFEGLLAALQELEEQWAKQTDVFLHLNALGISANAWGPKWYLTLFNYVLPFHSVLRVWDVFMLLGDTEPQPVATMKEEDSDHANFDVLHAATAAVLSALRDLILESDFEDAMRALTSSVSVERDDQMMLIAKRLWESRRRKG